MGCYAVPHVEMVLYVAAGGIEPAVSTGSVVKDLGSGNHMGLG